MKPEKKALEINRNKLEEEACELPALMFQAGEDLAGARNEVAILERQLKVRKAEVSRQVRINPEKYGYEKGTDKAVETAQDLDEKCQDLEERLIDAKYQKDILTAYFEALGDKRSEIRNLTLQHGQQYWSRQPVNLNQSETPQEREATTRNANAATGLAARGKR